MTSENELFFWASHGKYKVLVFRPWWERGLAHGFIGASFRFDSEHLAADARELCLAVGASRLNLVEQVHGTVVVECSGPPTSHSSGSLYMLGEGDGILIFAEHARRESACVYAIRTADCLPLIMKSGPFWGLVHAGWRGLSSGIVERALRRLQELSGSNNGTEVVIGPAASGLRYEVGNEVISAFKGGAVSKPLKEHKALLDLVATCRGIAEGLGARVFASNLCTISDATWHSHRRDGALSGRNLAYVVI